VFSVGYKEGLLRIFILSAVAFLEACTPRPSNVAQGNRDQVLHRGIGSEPSTLDPQLATTIAEGDIVSALFEGLVAEDPVDLHPVPGVAESWDISSDGLDYTFHLRADALWSDGSRVTAGDFVSSWRRMLTPDLAASNAGMLYVMENAEAFNKGAIADFSRVGVSAPDARTLRVKLTHAVPYFLSLLSQPAWLPVPVSVIERTGAVADRANPWAQPGFLVGNGPFVLDSWDANQRIEVTKSTNYWDVATVRLNGIDFYPIDSLDAEERAFRAGQLHITYALPAGKVEAYRADGSTALRTDAYLDTFFLRLNVTRPFLNDVRVRRALSLAVDRKALTDSVLRGGQTPAEAITPPGIAGYIPPDGARTDFDAARTLLASAGYPGGTGLPTFELLHPNSENLRLVAEALQEMWRRELGVNVRLVSQEFRVVLSSRREGQFEILVSDWVGDYIDPLTFLDLWRTDSANNYTRWSSRDYDSLLREASLMPNPAGRNSIYRRAETILLNEAPVIPLYYHTHAYLIRPSVRGWNSTLLDHHPYKRVWLEP